LWTETWYLIRTIVITVKNITQTEQKTKKYKGQDKFNDCLTHTSPGHKKHFGKESSKISQKSEAAITLLIITIRIHDVNQMTLIEQ
jgi:hypothetical protein